MKPIEYKAKSGIVYNIPRIISTLSVNNVDDTILSEEFQTNGAIITFPFPIEGINGEITKIKVPPCPHSVIDGMIVIDDTALKINNLLRVMRLVELKEKTEVHLSKSLKALQIHIIGKITQKQGILNQDILGTRMSNSMRAVLVPFNGKNPATAMLPAKAAKIMNIKKDDLVLIGRDPVIWHGSIEVLRVSFWTKKVIGINPRVFKQLGADSDGDTVWALKINDQAKEAAEMQVLKFSNNNFVPNTDGFSVSPADIFNSTKNCEEFKNRTGKDVQKEALTIASNINTKEFEDYILNINRTMLVQKRLLGPAGAVSNRLKLIGTTYPALLESANVVSERLQQVLFDYKGVVNSGNDSIDIFDMYDLISMRGIYKTTFTKSVGHTEVIDRLTKYGLNKKDVYPIITYIYSVYPMIVAAGPKSKDKLLELCLYENADNFRDKLSKILTDLKIDHNTIYGDFLATKRSLTIGNILDDPIYSLVNQTQGFSNETIQNLMSLRDVIKSDFHTGIFTSTIVKKVFSNV